MRPAQSLACDIIRQWKTKRMVLVRHSEGARVNLLALVVCFEQQKGSFRFSERETTKQIH